MKSVETLEKTTFSGRRFTRQQLSQVQETVQSFLGLSRKELAQTICENLNWKTPKGTNKIQSALVLLEKLEAQELIKLPAKRQSRKPVPRPILFKNAEEPIDNTLEAIGPISLQCAVTTEERDSWKSYVQSYHYLGYKQPIGSHLFYFVVSERTKQKLGCLLFSAAAAWTLAPRDKWIGWDKKHREKLLHLVLSQNRFLIFPWIKVSNLASKILSLSTKQVGEDWVRVHGYRPVLIETFVDTSKYSGTSYQAAGWQRVGETQGRGHDLKYEEKKSRKAIFLCPLQSNWKQCLTKGHRVVELKKRYRNDLQSNSKRSVGDEFISIWKNVIDIFHEVAKEYDETWCIRKRVIDSLILILLIFRLISSKNTQSYGTTIDDLWNSCDKLDLKLPQKNSIAPSSFCAARKKLSEDIFKSINRKILNTYSSKSLQNTWFGHRLFAVDGSKVNLPRELIARGYKIPSENAHYPQGLMSCLYQLKTQIPFDFDFVSHANERICAKEHLGALEKNDVVVYDRGYFSYEMFYRHHTAKIHAIFRLQKMKGSEFEAFFNSTKTDSLLTFCPPKRKQRNIQKNNPDIDIIPLKIRLLKYEIAGSTFYLGTTLTEEHQLYPLQEFMDVYHSRWGVEELYKVSKRIIEVEDFHARTERGVKQEIFAHFVLITMNRLFSNHADTMINSTNFQEQHQHLQTSTITSGKSRERKTNFKNCIHVVTRNIEELLLLRGRFKTVIQDVFNAVANQYQRVRPGRSYVRKSMRTISSKWCANSKKRKNLMTGETASTPA